MTPATPPMQRVSRSTCERPGVRAGGLRRRIATGDRGDRARGDRAGAARGARAADRAADRARSTSCATSSRPSTSAKVAASSSRASRAATASRPTPTRTRTSNGSCSTVRPTRLSGPALETLAIIAYKQPVSRAQLSAIRGVNVDATLKTLVAPRLRRRDRSRAHARQPALFGTTQLFLERLGLDSLDDLPALADFVPEASIVEALERGLRCSASDAPPEAEAEAIRRTPRTIPSPECVTSQVTANVCRRCSRAPASDRGARREVLIAGGPRDGQRRGRGARAARRSRAGSGSPSTVSPSSSTRPSCTGLLNKPAGYVTTADDPQGRANGARSRPVRPARVPGRSSRPRHRRPAGAHERRRSRAAAHASESRRGEGVPRRGRGRAVAGDAARVCARASSSTTAARVPRVVKLVQRGGEGSARSRSS